MIHIRISKQLWLFSFFFFSTFHLFSQGDEKLSFLFVGDVMQHGGQIAGAYNKVTDGYDYDDGFKFVKPLIEEKDIAIANLEVTHAGKPYKGYPQFSAPDELSTALKTAGFDVILNSNNHACDGGEKGVLRTLDILDKLGLKHTGTFRNKAERDKNYPLIIEKKGYRVAIMNYTYGTNGLKVDAPLIVNYIDSAVLLADFTKVKQMDIDYVICTMHWGSEYQSLPNAYQKNFEKYCYELGADMVIGGHPHVLQPVEKKIVNKKEKLTVWSLGNFVSNQRDRYKNGGLMVTATICHSNPEQPKSPVVLNDADYILTYVHVREEGVLKPYYILPEYNYNELRPDFIGPEDLALMNQFFDDSRKLFSEHSIGVKERKVNPASSISDLYKAYLTGYYAALIENTNSTQIPTYMQSAFSNYIHKVVKPDGTYSYLSGFCATKEQASEARSFLVDCKLGNKMKLVFVTPKEITIIEE